MNSPDQGELVPYPGANIGDRHAIRDSTITPTRRFASVRQIAKS
jgi:hypothetical protein